MLKTGCVNKEILGAAAECGHGDQIIIGSGNFPLDSQVNPDAKRVYLNLMLGVPTSDQVLKALVSILNIEAGKMILPPEVKEKPSVFEAYEQLLPGVELKTCDRDTFYDACKKSTVKLAIACADQRAFSNILVTVGVVRSEGL